jgi:glycosyltransferase involved in cell wall biosynthesis
MKFSITTPSFNQVEFLQRTIESVLAQTDIDLEYFVFDGGSTDGSVEILKHYDDRLTYWESVPDRGQSHAINKGFARSTGDVLAWLCSDDIYLPGTLAHVAKIFAVHPEVDVIYGGTGYIDQDDYLFRRKTPPHFSKHRLLKRDYIFQPSTFWRREVYEEIGPLDESCDYGMDYEYWLRMVENGFSFYREPKILSYMRMHNDAKSVGGVIKSIEAAKCIKIQYGYPSWKAQMDFFLAKYIKRCLWPIKRRMARILNQVGLGV